MSVRRSRMRAATTVAAMTLGLALSVTACGGGDDPAPSDTSSARAGGNDADGGGDAPSDGAPLAKVRGSDIELSVTSATRGEGGFVTVSGTVTNIGDSFWSGVEWKSDERELAMKNPSSMAAATLVDKKGKKRYYILRDTDGHCLCTTFKGGVQPNETKNWYTQFPAPPKDHDKVDFQIADMPPATITLSQK